MQRVSALLPSWDRNRTSNGSNINVTGTRTNSVDKVRGWADKIPSPVSRLSTSSRIGREAFWPTTLDRECEKAARILKSFCVDGFATPDERPASPLTTASNQSSIHSSHRILKKIPPRIIQNAVGLAVLTSLRSGLWTSGSGGSGVLIARKTDGTWSPPSGLLLQSPSLGFVLGVDIYDCVLIINNFTVLEAFARPGLTLGSDVRLTAGPLVSLGLLENDVIWTDLSDTAITYVKAKGQRAEIKLDGTVLSERVDENERFYGMKMGVAKILAGDINQSLPQTRSLTEVLKAAEGRTDYDMALVESLSSQPAPSDAVIESPNTAGSSPSFGIPNTDDPDPFGVLALEMAGMEIREAGTQLRPDSIQFEYHPSPTSPYFPKACRQSVDTMLSRSNRGSYMSNKTMATERSQMTDVGTQTYTGTPQTTPSTSKSQSEDGNQAQSRDEAPEMREPVEVDYTKIDISALRSLSNFPDLDDEPTTTIHLTEELETILHGDNKTTRSPSPSSQKEDEAGVDADGEQEDSEDESVDGEDGFNGDGDDDDDDDDFEGDEDAVVFEVATAQTPARMAMVAAPVHAKGAVVTIPRRIPPPLPARSPARSSRRRSQMPDLSNMVSSPLRQQFEFAPEALEAQDVVSPKAESIEPEASSGKEAETGITATASAHEQVDKSENALSIVTTTPESQAVDSYFPPICERSPLRERKADVTGAEASENTDEQVDFHANHRVSVPVSVA
ncbi:hypothetical protein F4778DRAFT_776323 [Xylariomycetidae sp. FL2044]|nr:hypothetical protein F4778DRAFT_776323 [Xylariomycetidae sp. FL2044]